MANTYLNRKTKKKALQVLKYTFLMLYLVIVMFPFFWMVSRLMGLSSGLSQCLNDSNMPTMPRMRFGTSLRETGS